MEAEQILTDVRQRMDDTLEEYMVSNETLFGHLNTAVSETCERTRTIQDSTSSATSITLVVDQAAYRLDEAVFAVRRVRLEGTAQPLRLVNTRFLDENYPGWDDTTLSSSGTPEFAVFDLGDNTMTLYPRPSAVGTLRLTVWRRPMEAELVEDVSDEPACSAHMHGDLRHWILYEVFSNKDSELYDIARADRELTLFDLRVGRKPSRHEMQLWSTSRIRGTKAHFD